MVVGAHEERASSRALMTQICVCDAQQFQAAVDATVRDRKAAERSAREAARAATNASKADPATKPGATAAGADVDDEDRSPEHERARLAMEKMVSLALGDEGAVLAADRANEVGDKESEFADQFYEFLGERLALYIDDSGGEVAAGAARARMKGVITSIWGGIRLMQRMTGDLVTAALQAGADKHAELTRAVAASRPREAKHQAVSVSVLACAIVTAKQYVVTHRAARQVRGGGGGGGDEEEAEDGLSEYEMRRLQCIAENEAELAIILAQRDGRIPNADVNGLRDGDPPPPALHTHNTHTMCINIQSKC